MPYAPARERGCGVYRFLALALVFMAVACGGDGSVPFHPTATIAPSEDGEAPEAQVAGTSTQAATATPPPESYEVAAGDTLSEIAARFSTTVEALVAANGLADANQLVVGQVLRIAAPADTETPTATAAAQ